LGSYANHLILLYSFRNIGCAILFNWLVTLTTSLFSFFDDREVRAVWDEENAKWRIEILSLLILFQK